MSNAWKRGRPTRRRGDRQDERHGVLRWPTTSCAPEPLFARIPQERCTKPDVTTHVICGHVVEESSELFECELRAQPHAKPGPSAVDASPPQQLSLVNRFAGTAFDSRKATPLRIPGVIGTRRHEAVTMTATSTVAAKQTSILSKTPPPPLLALGVVSARQTPASTVICVRGGDHPTAATQRNYDQNRSIPTTIPHNQAANASSHTACEAAAPDDALVKGEGDALAASAPCPPWQHPCAGERAIADGARTRRSLREMASQVSPPGPSRLARAPTEKSADEWTVEDVVRYVKRIPGCARHAEKFRKEEVDGEALLLLRKKHLIVYMGLPVGPAVKILRATRELRMRQHPN
ncbi:hypothetical protein MRX96_059430 [Rhipicephalus microplus]